MRSVIFTLLLALTIISSAQNSITSIGGNAIGSGGTASFTVGQTAWNIFSGSSGSILQGVQQPYEISVISGIEDYDINLTFSVYPNPTRDMITLKVDESDNTGLKYQLISFTGIVILEKMVEVNETEINLTSFSPSTYFLRVIKDQLLVRLFKIVKY